MAKVTVTRRWPDGDVVSVEVIVGSSYPDALDQCRKTAGDAFADALDVADLSDAAALAELEAELGDDS